MQDRRKVILMYSEHNPYLATDTMRQTVYLSRAFFTLSNQNLPCTVQFRTFLVPYNRYQNTSSPRNQNPEPLLAAQPGSSRPLSFCSVSSIGIPGSSGGLSGNGGRGGSGGSGTGGSSSSGVPCNLEPSSCHTNWNLPRTCNGRRWWESLRYLDKFDSRE